MRRVTSPRKSPSAPAPTSVADEVDALIDATTPEQVERIVSTWTKRAGEEATALLAPVRALVERGGSVDQALAAVESILLEQSLEMQRLTMQNRLATRLRFGKNSERLDSDELKQAYLAFEGQSGPDGQVPEYPAVPAPDPAAAEGDAELDQTLASSETTSSLAADAQAASSTPAGAPTTNDAADTQKKRRGGGRRALNEALLRIETAVRMPDADRPCVLCGRERTCVGHREHVNIEYVPAHVELHVEVREVLACLPCRKDMSTAPRAEPKRKVRAAPSLLAELLILKCDDALPLHRVREQLIRVGFDPPMSTLSRWWDYVTKLLGPVADVGGADGTHAVRDGLLTVQLRRPARGQHRDHRLASGLRRLPAAQGGWRKHGWHPVPGRGVPSCASALPQPFAAGSRQPPRASRAFRFSRRLGRHSPGTRVDANRRVRRFRRRAGSEEENDAGGAEC